MANQKIRDIKEKNPNNVIENNNQNFAKTMAGTQSKIVMLWLPEKD